VRLQMHTGSAQSLEGQLIRLGVDCQKIVIQCAEHFGAAAALIEQLPGARVGHIAVHQPG